LQLGLLALARALYLLCPLIVAAGLSGAVLRFELFRFLKRPIDGGLTFRGRRVFGDSKTWRGVAVAVVGCVLAVAVQKYLLSGVCPWLELVDYAHVDAVAFGAAMGAGSMLGELPNSFAKRQLGIAPGATTRGVPAAVFYVWDQVDLLTTAWPCIAFWVRPSLAVVVASFVLALVLHPSVSLIGYLIGARKSAR
jgi:hypothetical protein